MNTKPNSTQPERAAALRLLLAHHGGRDFLPHGTDECYWVTYLVGRGDELDKAQPGQASCYGFLCVWAAGPVEAERKADLVLAARTDALGCPYTVCAVHSAAQLLHGYHAIEALRAGDIFEPAADGDLEAWEETLGEALARFACGS